MNTEVGTYPRGGERDRAMIDDPMQWPNLRLPLKNPSRYSTDPDRAYGVLVTGMRWPNAKRVVYLGNLFDRELGPPEAFESTEALLAAGWVVD